MLEASFSESNSWLTASNHFNQFSKYSNPQKLYSQGHQLRAGKRKILNVSCSSSIALIW